MTEKNFGLPDFIADISTNMIAEVSKSGRILFFNKKAACIFGSLGQQPRFIGDMAPEQEISWLKHNIETALYQQYPHHFYFGFHNRFYMVYVYPQDRSVWLCFDDITEKRQMIHLLNLNNQRMLFAERISGLGYWELDLAQKQFYWSDEMYRIFGIEDAEKIYQRNLIRELIHPADLPLYKSKLKELVRERQDIEGQVRIVTPKNEVRYCRFMAGIIYENGETKIAGAFQDISALILMQQELEQAKQAAEEANLAKSYFLAQAGHDIRQSLHAIALFAEGLQNAPAKQYPDIAAKINQSSRNLAAMLNNLLDMSKLESSEMKQEKHYFNLADLLDNICGEYKDLADEKGIRMRCKTSAFVVYQDSFLVERIVRNLLANALKYAKKRIVVGNFKDSFWVIDDGIGISKDKQKHIFEMFYQCNNLVDRGVGSGLGLYIVSKIACLIGAKISIRSEPEHYTIFKVTPG